MSVQKCKGSMVQGSPFRVKEIEYKTNIKPGYPLSRLFHNTKSEVFI
jgi:hypothetical protein